jgi:hypothetical protein
VALRRPANQRGSRALGIGLLILSVVHVPLPQADYHNIRHHDAADEICVYHDHLLRWHPSADHDDDVTMLHWHWVVPLIESDGLPRGSDDEHHGPASGPSLHAHLGDFAEPDWLGDPVVRPDSRGRLLDQLTLGQSNASLAHSADHLLPLGLHRAQCSVLDRSANGGLRASRTALFQRWNC